MVFQCLLKSRLKLKEIKCKFWKRHIQYLSHLISQTGIESLPEQLSSLLDMPPHMNLKDVKQFLGLAGCYRKFVPRFANISQPLTALMKKDVPYKWTQMCQHSFDLLKKYLVESPIHKYSNLKNPYTLFTDATKYAWVCVLMKAHDHIIEGKERIILHPITYVNGLLEVVSSFGPLILKRHMPSICLSRNCHFT